MALRDTLKSFIPKKLIHTINHSDGYKVTAQEFNAMYNLNVEQGDDTAQKLKDTLTMLYETILHEQNGADAIYITVNGVTNTLTFYLRQAITDLTTLTTRVTTDEQNLATHKTGTDHDARYHLKTYLDPLLTSLTNSLNADIANLAAHKTSTDHDGRYYTEAEIDAKLTADANDLAAHKTGGDHDGRYYTEAEVDAKIAAAVLSGVSDNSVTNAKLATDVKVGSLASLSTTSKSSVVAAINEIYASLGGTAGDLSGKANLSGGNSFTGQQTVTDGVLGHKSTTATANKRWYKTVLGATSKLLYAYNDAESYLRTIIEYFHDGGVRIFHKLTVDGDVEANGGIIKSYDAYATANKRMFRWWHSSISHMFQALNDSGGVVRNLYEVFHDGGVRIFHKLTVDGGLEVTGGSVKLPYATLFTAEGGVEGGQLMLEKPASGSTLAGNVYVDVATNSIRFFEAGGGFRGAKLDLTTATADTGSNILVTRSLPSNTNLDTVIEPGFYRLDTVTAPICGFNVAHGQMIVSRVSDTIAQMVFSYNTGAVFTRTGWGIPGGANWTSFRRLSQDTGWKTATIGITSTGLGIPGYPYHTMISDSDYVDGDVVDFEVGYTNAYNGDITIAENAGMRNTIVSNGNGNFYFLAASSIPSIRLKYRINKG